MAMMTMAAMATYRAVLKPVLGSFGGETDAVGDVLVVGEVVVVGVGVGVTGAPDGAVVTPIAVAALEGP